MVKKEGVPNTMNKNAIHMLKSVEDAIGDSFIITTEDGKVIAIDGGYKFETDYFIQYLRAVTGQIVPKIDVWFLTHPHTDHVQVFNEVAENWSAFIGEFDDSFGIGIYTPHHGNFLAGVLARETTTDKDPSVAPQTSYIAAVKHNTFRSFVPSEYNYYIATGTVDEMRASFDNLR